MEDIYLESEFIHCIAQKGLIRALAKSAVCLVNLSANGAKVAGKVPAKDF